MMDLRDWADPNPGSGGPWESLHRSQDACAHRRDWHRIQAPDFVRFPQSARSRRAHTYLTGEWW